MGQTAKLGTNIGLTLGFNIFDGFNRKREQKNARITMENRQLELDRLKLSLQSDFSNMWMAYKNNILLTQLEEESLRNTLLNYEIAMDRYKLGDLSGIFIARSAKQFARGRATIADCQIPDKTLRNFAHVDFGKG